MATFNGRDWTVADMLPFKYVENWDAFFDDVIAEMGARTAAVGSALTSASTTSLPIGTGSKSLTVGANKAFAAGQPVVIAVTADATKYMYGSVTSYNATTGALEASVSEAAGSGTFSAWTVSLVGLRGAAGGATLPPGSAAAPGLAVTGDSDTGLAQAGGANTLSLVGFGTEVLRAIGVSGGTNLSSVTASNGGAPVLAAIGASPNIDIQWSTKGGGGHYFAANGANQVLIGGPIGADRMVYLAGSNGGNPTVSTTAGALNLTSATGQVLINGAAIGAGFPAIAKSSAYTVTTSDAGKLIVATGTWTLSLLAAATAGNGFTLAVSNSGSGIITVKPNGAETIGAVGAVAIGAGGSLIIICDGTSWHLIGAVSSLTTLDSSNKGASITLSNNNLTATNSTATWSCVRANTAITAGKWYIEFRQDVTDASPAKTMVGVASSSVSMVDSNHIGVANCWSLSDAGLLAVSGSNTSGWSSAWGAVGSVVGLYIDATNLASIKIWFALNGVLIASGDPTTGANPAATITGSPTLYPAVALIGSQQATVKFSKSSWQYTPVTGYNALP